MTPPALTLRLFASFAAEVDGTLLPAMNRRKSQWLLAMLALRLGREVSREWLAETLWPDSDPSRALFNLRQALAQDLRPALGASASLLRAPATSTLCLEASGAWVDVIAFDAALAAGTVEDLQRAVDLYRGPLLEGCLEEWALPERAAREEAFSTAWANGRAMTLERAIALALAESRD